MFDLSFIDTSSTDCWYDDGCVISQRSMQAFDDRQWNYLADHWQMQSEQWQERLAYILGGNAREAGILLAMCRANSNEVRMTARESLRDMPFDVVLEALCAFTGTSSRAIQGCASVNDVLAALCEGAFDDEDVSKVASLNGR